MSSILPGALKEYTWDTYAIIKQFDTTTRSYTKNQRIYVEGTFNSFKVPNEDNSAVLVAAAEKFARMSILRSYENVTILSVLVPIVTEEIQWTENEITLLWRKLIAEANKLLSTKISLYDREYSEGEQCDIADEAVTRIFREYNLRYHKKIAGADGELPEPIAVAENVAVMLDFFIEGSYDMICLEDSADSGDKE